MPVIAAGSTPPVQCAALWQWDLTGPYPVVTGYPSSPAGGFTPTKTGLTASDLQAFVGVPLQYYGNPPTPVTTANVLQWIRWAEDVVEQETSILLCQTWVASPPALTQQAVAAQSLIVNTSSGIQQIGSDYDALDSGYDFVFNRSQDEGWSQGFTRWRPLQSVAYGASGSPATAGTTAIKRLSYVYPLLNEFFIAPTSWLVEEQQFGAWRLVPAQNVQMLPLFAMQLAFMGFAESVPQAINIQYTAGLTPYDYTSRFSFMRELVLCQAAITALAAIQGTINLGADGINTMVDGLQMQLKYNPLGPFAGLMAQFQKRKEMLVKTALTKVAGPMFTML